MIYAYLIGIVVLAGCIQCIFDKTARPRWLAYIQEVGTGFDQFINTLIPPFGALGYADETLSARIWRAYRDGRIMGKLLMRPVNLCFRWQGYSNHCERAYLKAIERRYSPAEYRDPQYRDDTTPL
jgi:hypothetical protein